MQFKFSKSMTFSSVLLTCALANTAANAATTVAAPSPVRCIKATFTRPSGWTTHLTLTNECGSPVDFQNASIQFNTTDRLNTVWGEFGTLAYPSRITVNSTSNNGTGYLTVIGLLFPKGSKWWHPNTKLDAGKSFTLSYSVGKIDYDPKSVKVYTNFTPSKTGTLILTNATKKPQGSNKDPIVDLINEQTHEVLMHVSLPWSNEGSGTATVNSLAPGKYELSPETYITKKSHYTGTANPAEVTVKPDQTIKSTVRYSAVVKKGQISIAVKKPNVLKSGGYTKKPTVTLFDTTTKSQLQQSVAWDNTTTVSALNPQDQYQLSTTDIIFQNYRCVGKFNKNPIQPGSKTTPATTELTYACLAAQTVPVKIHVDGLSGSSKKSDTLTIKFTPNKNYPVVTQKVKLQNGKGDNTINLVDGKYGVEYTVSISTNIPGFEPQFSVNPLSPSLSQNLETIHFKKVEPSGLLYSPYKDATINLNWNTNVISTMVNGQLIPLFGDGTHASQLLPGNKAVTLAFATGICGSESWGGVPGDKIAQSNIPLFVKHNINYVISTGGAAGVFQCNSPQAMENFIKRYDSKNLVGIDFDIEGGYSPQQLKSLMSSMAQAQKMYPSLRVSLTLATLAKPNSTINYLGQQALQAARDAGLKFNVALMVMDYGDAGCQKNSGGVCDMAASAIYAAKEFSKMYHIPLSRIELTPMIGENDTQGEVTSLSDVRKIAAFVKAGNLAGLHYWSFDRDTPCQASGLLSASPTCNQSSKKPLEFDAAMLQGLGK